MFSLSHIKFHNTATSDGSMTQSIEHLTYICHMHVRLPYTQGIEEWPGFFFFLSLFFQKLPHHSRTLLRFLRTKIAENLICWSTCPKFETTKSWLLAAWSIFNFILFLWANNAPNWMHLFQCFMWIWLAFGRRTLAFGISVLSNWKIAKGGHVAELTSCGKTLNQFHSFSKKIGINDWVEQVPRIFFSPIYWMPTTTIYNCFLINLVFRPATTSFWKQNCRSLTNHNFWGFDPSYVEIKNTNLFLQNVMTLHTVWERWWSLLLLSRLNTKHTCWVCFITCLWQSCSF